MCLHKLFICLFLEFISFRKRKSLFSFFVSGCVCFGLALISESVHGICSDLKVTTVFC